MRKVKYVKPEIMVQKVHFEPFMTISGSGTDIPFVAPKRQGGFDEDEIADGNSDAFGSIWEEN